MQDRDAVVAQDLFPCWIQSYSAMNENASDTQKSLQQFMLPGERLRRIFIDSSLEFTRACEEVSWSHDTATPHRSETHGITGRALRRVESRNSICFGGIRF